MLYVQEYMLQIKQAGVSTFSVTFPSQLNDLLPSISQQVPATINVVQRLCWPDVQAAPQGTSQGAADNTVASQEHLLLQTGKSVQSIVDYFYHCLLKTGLMTVFSSLTVIKPDALP